MGSALLYLAIVVMWLSVLLPMWLRRDRHVEIYDDPQAEADTIVEAPNQDRSNDEPAPVSETSAPSVPSMSSEASGDAVEADAAEAPAPVRQRRTEGQRRASIVARRRRRLLWSLLLVLASVVTAAVRVMPWWGVAPSGLLLVGYLAVLRVAVKADAEQRDRAARARAEHLRRLREHHRAMEEMAREAEIIQLEARRRSQVFDQYADGRRAVGD
ncbi:hypothetical protein GCM10023194_74030 [Planotetraspora phitsanulokensis]|uniref:Transmembrane protein n=1 Tax=Planotetraspora phitsanulokensis TaxID=575192 RepID=A0A8J3XI05_9ACTN|nr:hypothetical protein [Planotetraspora phitsanulokensis]GII37098.1 hypothetical protein Pph01_21010 [Planotetraspora phitsanulokensis]